MAWREVSGASNTRDLKKEPPGTAVEGVYIGHRTFDTAYGEQTIWNFAAQDGTRFGIYNFTSLGRWMESVPVGAKVKIVYRGKEVVETKRGKVPMHMCQVFVDDASVPSDGPEFPPDPSEIPY